MNPAGLLAANQYAPTLGAFHDPWWVSVIKAIAIFIFLVVMTLFVIWFERRVVAHMHMRIGPNRAGPQGLLQSLADGIKLALKEDIMPLRVDKLVFALAPVISTVAAFTAFAVIPMGPSVTVFGFTTPLQLADLPVAVLFLLAMSSMGIYGVVLAGWSSGSTYPLLGGLRSAAQMVSYEVAMGLAFVAVFLFAGSLSTSEIVASQNIWYCLLLFPSFVLYGIAMVGETNRAPFDLAEAEGELVGGYHTEYSSLKFALFFLAEYINIVTVSAISVTLFLGGWHAPWPLGTDIIWPGANSGGFGVLWFMIKLFIMVWVFIWLRGTLPRLRYDQFMKFGWKGMIPVALAWILFVAAVRAFRNQGVPTRSFLIGAAVVVAIVLVLSYVWDAIAVRRERAEQEAAEQRAAAEAEAAETTAGPAHPVPPLDAPHYHGRPSPGVGGELAGTPSDGASNRDSKEVTGA